MSFIVTSLLFAVWGPLIALVLPPPAISPVTTALPLIVTLFSLAMPPFFAAVPPLSTLPAVTLPVTVAESIITLFFDASPCSASPPETLPVTVAPSLIVTLFPFVVPTPGIHAPVKVPVVCALVPAPDIIRLLLFASILIPGLLTFVPAISYR